MTTPPEHWLRGPVPAIPAGLQPVAHALLQARDEAAVALRDFPPSHLWERPAGTASVGFHLLHIAGVIDRLLTYARGESLDDGQRAYLAAETEPAEKTVEELLSGMSRAVDRALDEMRRLDETDLGDARPVGRLALPSTVRGLLFHAAEHTMRHLGQMIVTARVVSARE
jgi:uncharacterized damage-inducible protein DinB